MRKKVTVSTALIYAVLLFHTLLCLFPLFWTLLSSLKTNTEILVDTMQLPSKIEWQNYVNAWEGGAMLRYYANTLFVAFAGTVFNIFITSMATYVLARLRPSILLYAYFTFGLFLPVYTIILPLFKIVTTLKLSNTLWGLALVYSVVLISQTFFILYGYMRGISREMDEAAMIDGCSLFGTFFRIILPLSLPSLGLVGIFTFLFCWNEFFLPLVMMGPKYTVVSIAIMNFKDAYTVHYGDMTARIVLSVLPMLVVYLLFQTSFIKGLTAGAIKG